jgi:hypothetical protein
VSNLRGLKRPRRLLTYRAATNVAIGDVSFPSAKPAQLSDHPHYRPRPCAFPCHNIPPSLQTASIFCPAIRPSICLLCFLSLYSVLYLLRFHIHLGPPIGSYDLAMPFGVFDIRRVGDKGSAQTFPVEWAAVTQANSSTTQCGQQHTT